MLRYVLDDPDDDLDEDEEDDDVDEDGDGQTGTAKTRTTTRKKRRPGRCSDALLLKVRLSLTSRSELLDWPRIFRLSKAGTDSAGPASRRLVDPSQAPVTG